MTKIVTLTKGGIEKLIKAAGTVSPTSQKLAQYDGNGCIATNDPRFALDCVNKSYLESKLNGLGGGGSASGTNTPTANKIAAYDENARLHSTPKPEGANSVTLNEVVTFGDLTNSRVNDAYNQFLEFKRENAPFRVKFTSADPVTGGRVNLPIPDRDRFRWITRTTGAGGGYEYEMEAGYAYQVSWSIYGKAYFRSYNLFEDGTGFWNVSGTGENWKSETVIIWRKGGKPNIWLEHNGWQTGAGRIAVLQITQLRDVYI